MYRFNRWVIALLLIVGTMIPAVAASPSASPGTRPLDRSVLSTLVVVRVIDGDTVALSDGRRLRLLGVDTPETSDTTGRNYKTAQRIGADTAAVDAIGRAARSAVEKWVLNQPVRVEWDPQNQAIGHRDSYGRWLGYLYRAQDGLSVNGELIRLGYGLVYRRFVFKEKNNYLEFEREAYQNRAGLWREAKIPPAEAAPAKKRSRQKA